MPMPAERSVSPQSKSVPASRLECCAVLTKAVLRSADRLDLSRQQLAESIGVPEAFVSRLRSGKEVLEDGSESFRLAALLVRAFRSLDAIAGGNEKVARSWMKAENSALGGKPIEQITRVDGLVNVVAYLDAQRAPV